MPRFPPLKVKEIHTKLNHSLKRQLTVLLWKRLLIHSHLHHIEAVIVIPMAIL